MLYKVAAGDGQRGAADGGVCGLQCRHALNYQAGTWRNSDRAVEWSFRTRAETYLSGVPVTAGLDSADDSEGVPEARTERHDCRTTSGRAACD